MNIAYKIFTIFFIAILMFSQNIDARSVGASDRTATTEGTETRASSKRTSFAPRRSATGGVPPLERPSTNSRTGLSSTAKKFDRSTVYKEGDELGLKNVGAVTGIAYSRCLKTYSGCMDSYCKDLSRSKAMSRCACSTDVLDIKDEDGNIKIEGYYTKEKRQENTLEDLSATASYLQQLENINDPALLTRLTNVDDIENTLASLEDYFGGSRADSSGFDKDGNLLEEEEEGIDGGSTDDIWAKFGLGKDLYDKALEEQCELVLFSSVCKDVNVTVVSIEYSSKVVYDCKKYIMAISGMDKTIARTETALKKLALSITQQSYRSNNKLKFQGCLAELDDCIIKKCGKEYGNCITNNQYSVFSFGSSDVTYSSPALSLKYDSTTGAGDISLEKSRHNASLVGVINYINATLEPTKRNEIAGNTGRSLLPNEYQGYPIYSNLESKAESCSNIFDLCQDADRGLYVESDLPNKYNLINDSANTPENQRYTEADYARDHTARIGTVKSNEDKENNIFEAWFLGTALPSIKKTYLLAQTTIRYTSGKEFDIWTNDSKNTLKTGIAGCVPGFLVKDGTFCTNFKCKDGWVRSDKENLSSPVAECIKCYEKKINTTYYAPIGTYYSGPGNVMSQYEINEDRIKRCPTLSCTNTLADKEYYSSGAPTGSKICDTKEGDCNGELGEYYILEMNNANTHPDCIYRNCVTQYNIGEYLAEGTLQDSTSCTATNCNNATEDQQYSGKAEIGSKDCPVQTCIEDKVGEYPVINTDSEATDCSYEFCDTQYNIGEYLAEGTFDGGSTSCTATNCNNAIGDQQYSEKAEIGSKDCPVQNCLENKVGKYPVINTNFGATSCSYEFCTTTYKVGEYLAEGTFDGGPTSCTAKACTNATVGQEYSKKAQIGSKDCPVQSCDEISGYYYIAPGNCGPTGSCLGYRTYEKGVWTSEDNCGGTLWSGMKSDSNGGLECYDNANNNSSKLYCPSNEKYDTGASSPVVACNDDDAEYDDGVYKCEDFAK